MPIQALNIELPKNPFPGLRAFTHAESHLFFGREDHINDVLVKLESNHFVAVVGTSGTGKSSLIRAGVLPNLQRELDDNGNCIWEIVTITPGNAPLSNLANGIAQLLAENKSENDLYKVVFDLIQGSSLGLVQAMRGKLKPNHRLLILVDQFEEVFRFADEDAEVSKDIYSHFVQILIDTMRQRDVPIYTILTLRSDFLGDCVRFEGLPESINDGHYLVPRMQKRQVNRVITGPVEYVDGKISPRLIQEIVQNMGDDSDQLPILQHALMRTFDVWKRANISGEPMDVKHLQEVGGLKHALSKHADEAYEELDASGKMLIEKILKCLTVKTGDNRGVRRPMTLDALSIICESSSESILKCLEPFRKQGRTFILPDTNVIAIGATIFDISHESLMRGWERLRKWTDEEMESAAMYERIANAAILHQKGAAALWRDPELQLALDWKKTQKPTKAWGDLYHDNFQLAIDFLAESKFQATAEQRKIKRRKVIVRSAVAIFLVVVTILSGWALLQTNIANEKSQEALIKSEEALTEKERAEAEKANAIIASKEASLARDNAEKQADIAQNQSERADVERSKAEQAAIRAMAEQKRALEQENIANERSTQVLIQKQKADSARDAAHGLRMISLSQNLAYESGQIIQNPELASLLAIESYKLAIENGGNPNSQPIYSAATNALSQLDPNYSPIAFRTDKKAIALKAENETLAIVDEVGNFKTYNTTNFALSEETQTGLSLEKVSTAYISPGINRFVVGLNSMDVLGFDASTNKPVATFSGFNGLVRAVDFEDGFQRMVTGDRSGKLNIWKNATIQHTTDFGARISTIASAPHSDVLYVGCADGNAYRYSLSENTKTIFKGRSDVRVEVIAQSPDRKFIAIGYSDGLTQVFSSQGKLLKALPGIGAVNFLALDPSQNLLVITTTNRLMSLFDLSNLTGLPVEVKLDRPITAVAYDPESMNVYITCIDRTCHKYATRAEAYITELESKVSRNLSEDEWATFMGADVPYRYSLQTNNKN